MPSSPPPGHLVTESTLFARSLTRTVQALVSTCQPFTATLLTGADRVIVKQDPEQGIVLNVDGQPLLRLTAQFFCTWDGLQSFLAIHESKIAVYASSPSASEPLFRYEYLRPAPSDMPAAHIQFHAHRNEFAHVLSRTGSSQRRAKRRTKSNRIPQISEIHFPVGGHRFRPCLEDVLEMLIHEFGVDCPSTAVESLAQGREAWRRTQVRSAVRDAPDEAVRALREMGYAIAEPAVATASRQDRLRTL